ncbi:MAG: hypothetical protein ABW145_05675, partial [Candidatus Thiodiazotropha sp.]
VHPVINIAALGTLLAPLQPDGTLLAMTFLSAWAVGVACSPFPASIFRCRVDTANTAWQA